MDEKIWFKYEAGCKFQFYLFKRNTQCMYR
jgi:hypothetical protein